MSSGFRALRHRNYRLWAVGNLVSNIGTWMQRVAQDWLILTVLTHQSALALGTATALQFGPVLALSLVAGSLADRWPKRKILIATQATMGVLALTLGVLVITGGARLWNVLLMALLLGITAAFDGPSRQAFASEMVPPEDLTSAVSLNAGSFHSGRLVGPAVAGLLIAWFGLGPVFLINAGSFAAVLTSLLRMHPAQLYTSARSAPGQTRIRDSVRVVRARPQMVVILGVVSIVAAFGLNFQVTNGLMATMVFDRGPGDYGLMGSSLAVGSVLGALWAAGRVRPRIRLIFVAGVMFGLLSCAVAFLPSFYLYVIALMPIGLAGTTLLTNSNQTLQMSAEPAERGRIVAIYLTVNQGGGALGAPVIGWIASVAGARVCVLVSGLAALLACAAGTVYLLRVTSSRFHWERDPVSRLRWRLAVVNDQAAAIP